MKIFRWLWPVAAALALAACGGGGGNPGSKSAVVDTGGDTAVQPTAVVSSFVYQLSKNALTNSGSDSLLLTVTALDDSNNPVPGAKVVVSPDTGIYTPDASVTDAKGVVTGKLAINPNDKSDRNITSVINVAGKTATVVVPVTGSQIALAWVPTIPAPGASVSLDVKVTDVNGTAIPNVEVALSGTLGFSGTVKTGVTGSATVSLGAAPAAGGSYTIQATGSGVTALKTVQVLSSASAIPEVSDTISSASLAAVPNTIAPNVPGTTTNRSSLRAVFLNASNQAIQNVRVRFEIVPPGLGSGEQISTGDTVAYSDSNGVALAEYIAGTRSSPTNGVKIRACYGRTDAEIAAGACPNRAQTTLTVASSPLSITLGDDNTMETGNGGLTYIQDLDVAVADAAGYAVKDVVLSVSVDIRQYRKAPTHDAAGIWCLNEDLNRNGFLEAGMDRNGNGILDTGEQDWNGSGVPDPGEDLNANGVLDLPEFEDLNRNGTLEPRKADVIVSFSGSNKTDDSGRAKINVEWAQNFATWLKYKVKVTTNVAGSEGTVEREYITSYLETDKDNGSFHTPPYGRSLDCTRPD